MSTPWLQFCGYYSSGKGQVKSGTYRGGVRKWVWLVGVGRAMGLRPGWIWVQWGQRLETPMGYSASGTGKEVSEAPSEQGLLD